MLNRQSDIDFASGSAGYARRATNQIDLAVGQVLLPSVQETLKGMHPEFLKALGAKTSDPMATLGAFSAERTAKMVEAPSVPQMVVGRAKNQTLDA